MHNAWQVNFNLKVSTFESDFLGFMFVSSVGVVLNQWSTTPQSAVSEDRVESASAIGTSTGYAESKWVVEEILHQVADRANLSTTTARLGQVCGDRMGHRNEKEWFSAMVKSAVFTRCLPAGT